MGWAPKWLSGLLARPSRPRTPAPQTPPCDRDAELASALQALGFDDQRYAADHPWLASLPPADLARHYHDHGRTERLDARFSLPLPDSQARIDALDLPEDDRDLLRLDVAAAASRAADPWGRNLQRINELLAPSPAHRPLLVLGDSHSMLYVSEDVLRHARLAPVPHLCTGASARGLGNPASRAGAGERVRGCLTRLGERLEGAVVVLKFGQVDLEFVYDYRRIRDGVTAFDFDHAAAFARDSAARYAAFLRELPALTPARLVVTAALPPALSDEALLTGYMNAHIAELHAAIGPEVLRAELQRLVMPDWPTRTRLAALYNAAVAQACAEHDLTFYDDFTPLLGPDGIVAPELITWHGGTDHHLCFAAPAGRQAAATFAQEFGAAAA